MTCPLLSVVIVHWGNEAHLRRCVQALEGQTFRDFEVLIVENQVVSGSWFSSAQRLSPGQNLGFAGANNLGAAQAQGQWLVLLNNDAFPAPDWLERLLEAAERHPTYHFFASRLLQARNPDRLDGAGDVYHVSGLAWRRYYNLPAADFGHQTEEVFGPCAAAAMYDRQAFLEVGGFDERFFAYHEDVDLAFRLRLAGYRCLYVPSAVVYHVGSASTGVQSDFAVYHGHRNLVWTFLKNMPGNLLWRYLPLHWLMSGVYLAYYLSRRQGHVFWQARRDAWRDLPRVWHQRRQIQRHRKASEQDILRVLSRHWLAPLRLGRWRSQRHAS